MFQWLSAGGSFPVSMQSWLCRFSGRAQVGCFSWPHFRRPWQPWVAPPFVWCLASGSPNAHLGGRRPPCTGLAANAVAECIPGPMDDTFLTFKAKAMEGELLWDLGPVSVTLPLRQLRRSRRQLWRNRRQHGLAQFKPLPITLSSRDQPACFRWQQQAGSIRQATASRQAAAVRQR